MMTGRTSLIFDALPALRRSCGIGLIALAATSIAACGDESDPGASSETQTIASGGSGPGSTGASTTQNLAPWIAGSAPRQAMSGQLYSFRPSAGDPEGDALSFRAINLPRWAAFNSSNGRISGTPTAADVGRYSSIDVEVSDGQKTSRLGSFAIDVVVTASGTIAISWVPATERVDGSPLTSIRGHRIHWGTSPGSYTSSVFVQDGVTAHVIDNLLPASYYIAASTVDSNGIESALSSPVTITLR